jgi:hypothetical protein
MTTEDHPPQQERSRVDLGRQVAGIAAQVAAAIRSRDSERRDQLAAQLVQARERLGQTQAPPGLLPFIDVMCGMLRGQDVSALARPLPGAYRALYEQVVDETQSQGQESELTLRDVLDQVAHNVVLALRHGTDEQCRMMAETLHRMQRESSGRPDLQALVGFLEAARALLRREDPSPSVAQLRGPFLERWHEIVNAIEE